MDVSVPIGALGGLLKALWPSAVQASSRALTAHRRDCFCDFQRDDANDAFYCARSYTSASTTVRAYLETRHSEGFLLAVNPQLAPPKSAAPTAAALG